MENPFMPFLDCLIPPITPLRYQDQRTFLLNLKDAPSLYACDEKLPVWRCSCTSLPRAYWIRCSMYE